MFGWIIHSPRMPTIHTSDTTFGQAVCEVVYTLSKCPLTLCLGYRAEVLAFIKYRFLELVSRFHRLQIE